jgi:hypothetical protein
MLDNPVISLVQTIPDHFECNPSFIRDSHPRIGHQRDIQIKSARDTVNLLFNRARISIYKDMQQIKILS